MKKIYSRKIGPVPGVPENSFNPEPASNHVVDGVAVNPGQIWPQNAQYIGEVINILFANLSKF